MRADKLKGKSPYRGFHIGAPGSGKTGGVAALLNVGYKVRVLTFEDNFDPLVNFVDPKALKNLDICCLHDRLINGEKFVDTFGKPTAFNKANEMLIEWKYKEDDGTEVNLGRSAEWGLDTVVLVDSGSSLARAVVRRAIHMNSKTKATMTSAVWGHARADFDDFIEILKQKNHHLIVNVHKQMLGPSDFITQSDQAKGMEDILEKKLEAIKDNLIPTRYYPIAVTKSQAQNFHGSLPTMLEFTKATKYGKEVRVIRTATGPEIDVKAPMPGLKDEYPLETGLADIFKAMGYTAPGLK